MMLVTSAAWRSCSWLCAPVWASWRRRRLQDRTAQASQHSHEHEHQAADVSRDMDSRMSYRITWSLTLLTLLYRLALTCRLLPYTYIPLSICVCIDNVNGTGRAAARAAMASDQSTNGYDQLHE